MNLKNILPLLTLVCSSTAFSFMPHVSQLARFQPDLQSRHRNMSSSGHIEFQGNKLPYTLEWFAPEHYRVSISQISPSIYSQGQGSSTWTLTRRQSSCILKAGNLTVNCPAAHAWGLLELSGSADSAVRGLFAAEIIDTHEISLQETDSTLLETFSEETERVHLVMSRDGKTPSAQLEIAGPRAVADSDGELSPIIRFDQSFLAPTFLRVKHNGELFSIAAESDLQVRRDRSRFTWVFSNTLNVSSDIQQSLRIVRSELKSTPRQTPPATESSLSQVDMLKNNLSVPGLFLLDALLLTH